MPPAQGSNEKRAVTFQALPGPSWSVRAVFVKPLGRHSALPGFALGAGPLERILAARVTPGTGFRIELAVGQADGPPRSHPRTPTMTCSDTVAAHPRRCLAGWAAALALLGGQFCAPLQAQWTVVDLHPPGAFKSDCYDVQDGQQFGTVAFVNEAHAAMWSGTAASVVDLHPAGPTEVSRAFSGAGLQQVGRSQMGNFSEAFLWSGTAGSAVNLNPVGATYSEAVAIDGNQIGGNASIPGQSSGAGFWDLNTLIWTSLQPPGQFGGTTCFDVQGGHQVGAYNSNGILHAVLWSGSGASWVDLDPNTATNNAAYGVWGNQQVGYREFSGKKHAALWTGSAASFVDLHPAGALWSELQGVDSGVQVGNTSYSYGTFAGVWKGSATSFENLSYYLAPDYAGALAYGIWVDGASTYVVGTAGNAGATNRATMWVSEPAWTNMGSALAGINGNPLLLGTGALTPGSSDNAIRLHRARGSKTAGLFVSLNSSPVPFKGGTLLPVPWFLDPIILTTSSNGRIDLPVTVPANMPPGTEVWFQWAISDTAAVQGVSLSNGLRGVTP